MGDKERKDLFDFLLVHKDSTRVRIEIRRSVAEVLPNARRERKPISGYPGPPRWPTFLAPHRNPLQRNGFRAPHSLVAQRLQVHCFGSNGADGSSAVARGVGDLRDCPRLHSACCGPAYLRRSVSSWPKSQFAPRAIRREPVAFSTMHTGALHSTRPAITYGSHCARSSRCRLPYPRCDGLGRGVRCCPLTSTPARLPFGRTASGRADPRRVRG